MEYLQLLVDIIYQHSLFGPFQSTMGHVLNDLSSGTIHVVDVDVLLDHHLLSFLPLLNFRHQIQTFGTGRCSTVLIYSLMLY